MTNGPELRGGDGFKYLGVILCRDGTCSTEVRIFFLEHKTNDWVRSKIDILVDAQEPLLATACQETETCMVRACCTSRQPLQNHLQGTLEGGRRRGRQKKC